MVEKLIGTSCVGHYSSWGAVWKEIEQEPFKHCDEKEFCMKLAKENKGSRFRVRSIWDGKIEMEIML